MSQKTENHGVASLIIQIKKDIRRTSLEFNINLAEIVGCLEIVKHDIIEDAVLSYKNGNKE